MSAAYRPRLKEGDEELAGPCAKGAWRRVEEHRAGGGLYGDRLVESSDARGLAHQYGRVPATF